MPKGIMPELLAHDEQEDSKSRKISPISEELKEAIENLIYLMREKGPR